MDASSPAAVSPVTFTVPVEVTSPVTDIAPPNVPPSDAFTVSATVKVS